VHWQTAISAKLLKVKGSGAEARAEGPFLLWQNRSGLLLFIAHARGHELAGLIERALN